MKWTCTRAPPCLDIPSTAALLILICAAHKQNDKTAVKKATWQVSELTSEIFACIRSSLFAEGAEIGTIMRVCRSRGLRRRVRQVYAFQRHASPSSGHQRNNQDDLYPISTYVLLHLIHLGAAADTMTERAT
ncbi:uncharacterized protein ACNLHF_002442 [Anomaloglossus baeobatrachus]